jgi:acetyl-CoA decarbonylase/synthase, CODH/ACS complex subunit delta
MSLELPKTSYNGRIKEVVLGKGQQAVTVGGESCYPFYTFEGSTPHLPRIAMEVWDSPPGDWPEAALAPFIDVINDPVAWALKCQQVYGAEMICLQLVSTDPNGENRSAEAAGTVVKRVAEAVSAPLIVWGTANHEKDTEVLKTVCEVCQGKNLIIGPVEEGDYKKIAATALGYGHTVVASTPIDVNLAKQLNILLGNLGVADNQIIIDPTVSSIGYGIEYCYSVMERIRMAALTQQDDKLQSPIVCNISRETWKTKEAKLPDDSRMGQAAGRGILLEAISANTLLLAGADIVVMRHPQAIKLVKHMIGELGPG